MTDMNHWVRELQSFRNHLSVAPGNDYRSWQPTKWQSLESVRDRLLAVCWAGQPKAEASALELGCGSATLLVQLQQVGVRCIGVDRDAGARTIASVSAASMKITGPTLLDGDFFDADFADKLPLADLVFHVGVIEHLGEDDQLALLELSARLSHRWVMIGIPHEHGPVFRGFLKAVTARNSVYDVDHKVVDIQALVRRAGYRLVHADGLHLFYSSPMYYTPGDPELDRLYACLRGRLVAAGGVRYSAFPYISFTPEDIELLRFVEDAIGRESRYRNAFLRYYIVDTRIDSTTENDTLAGLEEAEFETRLDR